MAQRDVLTIQGGSMDPGTTKTFPIYFQDVAGTTIDTGTDVIQAFNIDLTLPASLIAQASFAPAGVLQNTATELVDSFQPDNNRLIWFVVCNPSAFRLGPPAPGDLIGNLSLTTKPGTAGNTISMVPLPETLVQAQGASLTISVGNSLLETAIGAISINGATPVPVIEAFTVNPTAISQGASATLSWQVTGADSVSINQGIGSVGASGSRTVSPTTTTTYQLTATNLGGQAQAEVTVTLMAGLPQIVSFTANPTSIPQGASTLLSWQVTGVDSVNITPAPGSVQPSGSASVSPATTTTYRLTATNTAGSTSAEILVGVNEVTPPVINSFSIEPQRVPLGSSTTIHWNVSLADTIDLDDTSGNHWTLNGSSGNLVVTPEIDAFFTLTATNAFGQVTSQVFLAVAQVVQFQASPAVLFQGQSTTLSWIVVNADSVSISPEIGTVSSQGSIQVSMEESTTFKLSAPVGGAVLMAQATVQVLASPTLHFPLVRSDAKFTSEIVIVNLDTQVFSYEFQLWDKEGELAAETLTGMLDPLATLNIEIEAFDPGTGWAQFRVLDREQAKMGGIINTRTRDGEELDATNGSLVPQAVLYVPHIAKDPQFNTTGAIVSTGAVKKQFWFESDAESFFVASLGQRQQSVFDFRDLMGGEVNGQGWGRLNAADEQGPLVGVEVFGRADETLRQSVAVSLDGNLANTLIFPHLAKQVVTFWTGVVIINAGQETAQVVYTVRNDEGQIISALPSGEILPGEKKTFLVDQNRQDFGQGASWLTVQGNQPLNGYMLFGTYPPDDRFSGFQSAKQASRNLCFPYLDESTREGGYTGLAIVNPGVQNSVRLRLINAAGQQKEEITIPMGPNQKIVNLASQLFDTAIEPGDKILAQASQPIVAFEIYGQGTMTLGGVLAVTY